jgi:hypothetical protein
MKTNSGLNPIVLSILFLFVICMNPIRLVSQEISTVGEIYDYEVNDVYHYYLQAGNINGYTGMWSITNIKIINKYYSPDNETVYYVRDVAYKAFYYPDPETILKFYSDTISYTHLNYLINNGEVDSVYSDPDLYNGRKINFNDCLNKNYVWTSKYVNGCGMTSEYFYSWESQSESSDELVYFKKGEEEWGSEMLIVSVENPELFDMISMVPNPAKNTLKIETTNNEIVEVAIISMNGIRVKSCELTPGQTTIDISDLDSGFYIVQFDVNGKITSKKLVIE